MKEKVAILQTGRLGDLWYTTPLACWFHEQGYVVEVVYDQTFGNPFEFFPYIESRPVELHRYCAENVRWGHVYNEAVWQLSWVQQLKAEGRRVVWNEIFPFRWLHAHWRGEPYVEHWYRKYPQVNFRRAKTSLEVHNEKTILVFQESQSLRFKKDQSYQDWIFGNLKKLTAATGYRPVVVAYGSQPDHPEYETWRGSLDEYQKLIARCGMIYGISTSAHVLGQLLGKPIVALYKRGQSIVDTVGGESIALYEGDELSKERLAQLTW